jgi:hypothetical protein
MEFGQLRVNFCLCPSFNVAWFGCSALKADGFEAGPNRPFQTGDILSFSMME